MALDHESLAFYSDARLDVRTMTGARLDYVQHNPLYIVLKSGLVAMNKPNLDQTEDPVADRTDDFRYCDMQLDLSSAEAVRDFGWTAGRLQTQLVSFSDYGFDQFREITDKTEVEAYEEIAGLVGSNHQLLGLKPLGRIEASEGPALMRQIRHAAMLVIMQTTMQPDIRLFVVSALYESDATYTRDTEQLIRRLGSNAIDPTTLETGEIGALSELHSDFIRASEEGLAELDSPRFRLSIPGF
jgi:hypothetical protein